MIQISPQMKIFVSLTPIDFRKGIDGLCQLCRSLIKEDPFSGSIFVFRNKSKKSIKLLMYDGQGFWHCQKRLSQGKFNWLAEERKEIKNKLTRLESYELQLLLWNGNPNLAKVAPFWKKIL